ncbi:MAG: lipid-binding SYLF domain-containing protein [Alphaproteobacteria bacterium]|nr:lipid-binding SYLF domain-containing protein [Alphaproteobacteria bacterium]
MSDVFSRGRALFRAAAAVLGLVACAETGGSGFPIDQQAIVDQARLTIESMRADPSRRELNFYLANARGVLIVPSSLKGALFLGGEGGNGVMLSRNADGSWSCPAFYAMGSVSYFLQLGVMKSEIVFVLMNDDVMRTMMEEGLRLGIDASAAVGGFGGGAQASTSNLFRDVYVFTQSSGAFVGVAAELGLVTPRDSWNQAYYGRQVTPGEILLERRVCRDEAGSLRTSLGRP